MADQNRSDAEFTAMTFRLLRRKALRRDREELNTVSGPGLEALLEQISAEVTADAAARKSPAEAVSPKPRAVDGRRSHAAATSSVQDLKLTEAQTEGQSRSTVVKRFTVGILDRVCWWRRG